MFCLLLVSRIPRPWIGLSVVDLYGGSLHEWDILNQKFLHVVKGATVKQVKEGSYDHKVSETANVVTAKTSEIGQKTWGLMKGVMALASQKVEEYTKEGSSGWINDGWQRNETQGNGSYKEFEQEPKGWNYSASIISTGFPAESQSRQEKLRLRLPSMSFSPYNLA